MRAVDSACHTEGEERFPSEPVTPTPDVEREEDGHRVFRDGDYVVEADHLDNKCLLLCIAPLGNFYIIFEISTYI